MQRQSFLRYELVIVFVLFLLFSGAVRAQVGKQFWFSSPEMALHSRDMSLRLYVFAEQESANVTISMPSNASYTPYHLHLESNGYQEIVLASNYEDYMSRYASYHNRVNANALLIESDAFITAYIQMTGVNSETYTLKGENALGVDFHLALQNKYNNSLMNPKSEIYRNAYSSAQVVATEDSTEILIEPSQLLYGDESLSARRVILNRGESYSFRASGKMGPDHIVGTRIRSNKPIVVHTMDDSMSPHQDTYGEDAVAEQMVPSSLLGTDYIVMGCGVPWEGVVVTDLETGASEYIPMDSFPVMYIHRDHPVQVFQVTGYKNEAGGTQLPCLAHSGSKLVHYKRLQDSEWTTIHILTRTSNIDSLTFNGVALSSSLFQVVDSAPEWSYAVLDVSDRPRDEYMCFRSTGGVFHLSVSDATSCVRAKSDGHAVATSCSYGYFSSYIWPIPHYEEIPDTIVLPPPVDTVVVDTIPEEPQDTVKKEHHGRILLYGEGAYSHIPFGNSDFRWGAGYGAGIGVLYEYVKEHLLFDVGLGFLWQDVEHKRHYTSTRHWEDTQQTDSKLGLQVDRSDRSRLGYIEVPVLVGGQWDWFYLLGGVKVGVPLFGNTRGEAHISDCAQYERYWDLFSDMSNHGLRQDAVDIKTGSKIDYKVDTRLSVEFGVRLGQLAAKHAVQDTVLDMLSDTVFAAPLEQPLSSSEPQSKVDYRLGVYMDYGFMIPTHHSDAMWMDETDFIHFENWGMNHPLKSTVSSGKLAQNFFVGIKLTIGFNW